MPKRSESLLEKLKLGQQGWNEVLSRNAQRLNDILLKVDGLLDVDITGLATGDVLWWNASSQKFENVNKAYAISAGSVSSWSSESSHSSVSSDSSESSLSSNASPSSESSESSESSGSNISSSSSSYSSLSSASIDLSDCVDWGADLTTGETPTASDDYNSAAWAIDGDTTHGWASDEILPEWWKVQLTTPANIERLRIYPYVNVAQHPTAFTFQASNSGDFTGEEDTLLTVSGYTWTSGVWGNWQFTNGQEYRYYRIYITATNDENYTRLNEIQMYQCDARSGSSSSESSESSHSSLSSLSSESSGSSSSSSADSKSSASAEQFGTTFELNAYQDDGAAWESEQFSQSPTGANGSYFGDYNSEDWQPYYRWNSINIPQGATILSAYARFYSGETRTQNVNVLLDFEDINTSIRPSSYSNVKGATLTGNSAAWNITGAWNYHASKNSPSLVNALQAVINRVGWSSGNSVTLHVKENSSTAGNYYYVRDRSFSTDYGADLIVTWEVYS